MPSLPTGFTNPLLSYGPDPWVICHNNGFYYYTHSTRTDLTIWKTPNLTDLIHAEHKVVWNVPESGPFSKNAWAPELHYLDNGEGRRNWYAYLSADDGLAGHQRIWVLENDAQDPLEGTWCVKQQLITPDDKWGIDGTVMTVNGQLYLAWSGWEGDENGQQNIYLCRMSNPWTCVGRRLLLSAPTLLWERHNRDADPKNPRNGVLVNEAPGFLLHGDYLFIAYSASGCWTDEYAMGLLTARLDSDLMQASSWTKSPEPVFKTSVRNGVFGPGHGCFFNTDNGHTWLLYHANPGPGKGCENERTPRLQRIHWHQNGMPDFGVPADEKRVLSFE